MENHVKLINYGTFKNLKNLILGRQRTLITEYLYNIQKILENNTNLIPQSSFYHPNNYGSEDKTECVRDIPSTCQMGFVPEIVKEDKKSRKSTRESIIQYTDLISNNEKFDDIFNKIEKTNKINNILDESNLLEIIQNMKIPRSILILPRIQNRNFIVMKERNRINGLVNINPENTENIKQFINKYCNSNVKDSNYGGINPSKYHNKIKNICNISNLSSDYLFDEKENTENQTETETPTPIINNPNYNLYKRISDFIEKSELSKMDPMKKKYKEEDMSNEINRTIRDIKILLIKFQIY